jgi:hypothetical protein
VAGTLFIEARACTYEYIPRAQSRHFTSRSHASHAVVFSLVHRYTFSLIDLVVYGT